MSEDCILDNNRMDITKDKKEVIIWCRESKETIYHNIEKLGIKALEMQMK